MKQTLLAIALSTPLFYLLYALFIVGVDDPIKYIYTVTGTSAIVLLFATTSLSLIAKTLNLIRYRRTVGLFGFFYALLHFINFIVLDMELDITLIIEESLKKPFIYLGLTAFLGLLFMALTSTKRLFKKYHRYHRILYGILVLVTIHFIMSQKALSVNQWGYLLIIAVIAVAKLWQRRKMLSLRWVKYFST